jgi:beta-phosphoglucomutase
MNDSVNISSISRLIKEINQNHDSLLIFDFDGVIADTEPLHKLAYITLLEKFGISKDIFNWSDYKGKSERDIYKAIERDHGIKLEIRAHRHERLGYVEALIEEFGLGVRPEISRLLGSTSTKALILSSQEESFIHHCLQRWGCEGRFDKIAGLADAKESKSEWLANLVASVQIPPKKIYYFEDTLPYLEQAQALGITPIYVQADKNGAGLKEELEWVIVPKE